MSTVIDCPYRDNFDRQQLWDRFGRADLLKQYLDWQAHGVSPRQAATQLQVPRSPLQAWHSWHETLDICPHVAQFFQRGPGLAFLHRLVLALPLVCVEVGACRMRLVCLLLPLTGLDRFVAAAYGAQQQVHRQVDTPWSTTAKWPPPLGQGHASHSQHRDPRRNLHGRPLPRGRRARQSLHDLGTTRSGSRSRPLE